MGSSTGQYLIKAGYKVHVITFDFREPVNSGLVFIVCRNSPADWRVQKLLKNFLSS